MSYYDLNARFVPIVAWPGERSRTRRRSPFKATWGATEALRKVDRYGVTKRGEQYTGWKRLPSSIQPAMTVEDAATFMAQESLEGYTVHDLLLSPDCLRDAYRYTAKRLHPDTGGTTERFQRLQEAKRVLDQHHGVK